MPVAGGLSDALGRMASNEDRAPRVHSEAELEIRSARSLRADETTVLPVDQILPKPRRRPEQTGGMSEATRVSEPATAGAPQAQRTPARAPRKDANHELKRTAIPVLITVALVLLVPGVWAVLLMAGMPVFKHADPGADRMALAMLMTWPISLCMIGGAVFFWVQTSKASQQATSRRR